MKRRQEPPTHYQVLGISPSATAAEIHQHYKELALRHHPDRYWLNSPEYDAATDRFARITEAYGVLRNAKLRAAYDARLKLLGLTCPACEGLGTVTLAAKTLRATTRRTQVCGACNGTGRDPRQ
jgi:DnaJ-class molecular chaperone